MFRKHSLSAVLVMAALSVTFPAQALAAAGWNVYRGAWFEIKYPAGFMVRESMPSATSNKGYDSVFFASPDGLVEFYVYSPQWSGEPSDILPDPATEVITDRKEQRGKDRTVVFTTLRAKDGGYWRSLADTMTDNNTRTVFGYRYKDGAALKMYRPDYLTFKKSLVQYAD
jgi:hypothetical protein